MRKKIPLIILLFVIGFGSFAQTTLSQNEFTVISRPLNKIIKKELQKIEEDFSVSIIKKNEKPFKDVEIYIDGRLIGTTDDAGKYSVKMNKSKNIMLLFKKGGKQFAKAINFSEDSLYTISLKLHNSKHTKFNITSRPLEVQIYNTIKNCNDIYLLSAYNIRFPKGSHKKEVEAKLEAILFNTAKKSNSLNEYQRFLLIYPKGQYVNKISKLYDDKLFAQAKKENTMKAYKHYLDNTTLTSHKVEANNKVWDIIKTSNTAVSYDRYMKSFPDGPFVDEANKIKENILYKAAIDGSINNCITYLEHFPNGKYKLAISEKKKYLVVAKTNDEKLLNDYLKANPNSKYILEAETLINKIEQKKEDNLYNLAIAGTTQDCNNYLKKYPKGNFVKEVKDKKNELKNRKNFKTKKKIEVSDDEYYALNEEITKGNLNFVKKWVADGKQIEPSPGSDRLSALFGACVYGQTEIAKFLLNNGANIDFKYTENGTTNTLLLTSVALNVKESINHDILKLLLEKGANPNVKMGRNNITIVDFCIGADIIDEYAQLFFKNKYNPNYLIPDPERANTFYSPLSLLITDKNLKMARYFLGHGADSKVKLTFEGTKYGLLDLAEEGKLHEMQKLLKSYGAPNYIKKSTGRVATVGDIFNFFDNGSTSQSSSSTQTPCDFSGKITKTNKTVTQGNAIYRVYWVKCPDGYSKQFYYQTKDSFAYGKAGYYEYDVVVTNYLGKTKQKALEKLCGCN